MKVSVTIEKKVQEELPEFFNEVNSLSADHLDSRLATLAKDAESVREAKAGDEELKSAQENSRNLGAPYRDALKTIALKSKYLIRVLKDRGGQ